MVAAGATRVAVHDHLVHLHHEDDDALVAGAAAFLADALARGDVALVNARPERTAAVLARLEADGTDVESARAGARLRCWDAAEVSDRLVDADGILRRDELDATVRGLLDEVAAMGASLAVFGEAAGLLWARGAQAAALEVEARWAELGASVGLSLYCAYEVTSVRREIGGLAAVGAVHRRVLGADTPPTASATRRFQPSLDAARAARRFVAERLVPTAAAADVALVVAELATNAILHAGTPFDVELTDLGTHVRIAVADEGEGEPATASRGEASIDGRGLRIVESVSDRWGVERTETGKRVWAELALT